MLTYPRTKTVSTFSYKLFDKKSVFLHVGTLATAGSTQRAKNEHKE